MNPLFIGLKSSTATLIEEIRAAYAETSSRF